ncbi:MAG: electron transfer flavoprotein subunit beta/FixA family protein [Actinomycetota bacterium]|nr:electron transfer flavoprotein subunit beta/FixA family protein [Actinomycetota bacterium]
MRIVVAMRQLADLVEELEVDDSGTDIDREFVKFVANEFDESALEEALLIKEGVGADQVEVVAVALDEPDVDQTLYTALAKGADKAVKLAGVPEGWVSSHTRASAIAKWLESQQWDLVITGVQAADDLDGQVAGLLGRMLGVPHVAVVVSAVPEGNVVKVSQELGGGTVAEEEVAMPAVLGVQAARQSPRYAPITRIRQAMQAGGLSEETVEVSGDGGRPTVRRLYAPEKSGQAEMLTGSAADVADKIIELIRAKGLVKS